MTIPNSPQLRCVTEDLVDDRKACPSITGPLATLLEELYEVLHRLPDPHYVQKPVGVVASSIGGHVRHCLDHVRQLLMSAQTGRLDYDQRQRGTNIETSRLAAMALITEFQRQLIELPPEVANRSVWLSVLISPDALPAAVHTSFGREAAYVLSHTIHHNALVAAIVKMLGGWLPDRFGYAPATLAHRKFRNVRPGICPAQEQRTCVR